MHKTPFGGPKVGALSSSFPESPLVCIFDGVEAFTSPSSVFIQATLASCCSQLIPEVLLLACSLATGISPVSTQIGTSACTKPDTRVEATCEVISLVQLLVTTALVFFPIASAQVVHSSIP